MSVWDWNVNFLPPNMNGPKPCFLWLWLRCWLSFFSWFEDDQPKKRKKKNAPSCNSTLHSTPLLHSTHNTPALHNSLCIFNHTLLFSNSHIYTTHTTQCKAPPIHDPLHYWTWSHVRLSHLEISLFLKLFRGRYCQLVMGPAGSGKVMEQRLCIWTRTKKRKQRKEKLTSVTLLTFFLVDQTKKIVNILHNYHDTLPEHWPRRASGQPGPGCREVWIRAIHR